jgi:hypothetical protein
VLAGARLGHRFRLADAVIRSTFSFS